jgi:outer membrane protein assembly factor BamB
VLWSVNSPVVAAPVLVGDDVVSITGSGRVESRRRSNGNLRWTREIGTISWGAPLLHVGGRVIVPAYQLHALDPATGAVVWSYNGPDGRTGASAPGVAGDTLFVADQGGIACALRAADGGTIWCVDMGEGLFTPTVHQDLVIYPTRGYLTDNRTSLGNGGAMVALNRFTGAEVWRFELPNRPGELGDGGAVVPGLVVGDRLIVGAMNGSVYAMTLTDGTPLWTVPDSSGALRKYLNPLLEFAGYAILVRSDGHLEARDPSTGSLHWTQQVALLTEPRACGPYLCVANARMFVIDEQGEIVWAYGGGSTGWGAFRFRVDSSHVFYTGVKRFYTVTFEAIRIPVEF